MKVTAFLKSASIEGGHEIRLWSKQPLKMTGSIVAIKCFYDLILMQEIGNFCWKGCELYFLWVCCIRARAYFSKAEVLMACLTFLQCRRWGPTTCASRCTQCTQLVRWAFRLGAEIVVEGGNACNWRYPSELYQNFTLIIIHCELPGNCTNLTRSLTWNMTVWF